MFSCKFCHSNFRNEKALRMHNISSKKCPRSSLPRPAGGNLVKRPGFSSPVTMPSEADLLRRQVELLKTENAQLKKRHAKNNQVSTSSNEAGKLLVEQATNKFNFWSFFYYFPRQYCDCCWWTHIPS